MTKKRILPIWLYIVHWFFILNFVAECFYAAYIIFFQIRPKGHSGPLWGAAKTISHEMMVTRRLYATEFWIAVTGLALYLALTEIGPRIWLHYLKSSKGE